MNDRATFLSKANPKLLLTLSRVLAAARPAILAFLIAQGSSLAGENTEIPISFCNVLFVGNLCAAIAVCLGFNFKQIIRELKTLKSKTLLQLLLNGCLAALLSSLIFLGLEYTSVTNSILISRLGPVLYAVVGTLLLGRKISKFELVGFSLIVVGIGAITLRENNFQLNRGDALILASAVVYACTSLIGKAALTKKCSLQVVVFTRNFISAIVFFIIAVILFGFSHFGDVFSGGLWVVMSIYGLIMIVLAELFWYSGLKQLNSKTVGAITSLSPIFGIGFAYFINDESPSKVQFSALVVILFGLFISKLGKKDSDHEDDLEKMSDMESCASGN
ncbi:MAG: DMT family transporter [Cyanobacteria bacterium P01_A01_bin.83]